MLTWVWGCLVCVIGVELHESLACPPFLGGEFVSEVGRVSSSCHFFGSKKVDSSLSSLIPLCIRDELKLWLLSY
jgi:hypothetical protein